MIQKILYKLLVSKTMMVTFASDDLISGIWSYYRVYLRNIFLHVFFKSHNPTESKLLVPKSETYIIASMTALI